MVKEQNHNRDKLNQALFRKEALEFKKTNHFGKIIVIMPISFAIWAWGIFFVALSVGLFLYFGEYTKNQMAQGVLVPDKGMVTIYARAHGIISNKFVTQGETVLKGQILYLISTEQASLSQQSVLAQQSTLLQKQIAIQKHKIQMFEKNAVNYDKLLTQHYISMLEYQNRQEQYFNAQLTLHNYEKELNQANGALNYAIRSPIDGTLSSLIATVGNYVTDKSVLGSIIPKNSILEGQFFVPTSKSGFIKPGQKILLRYYAYPYQRFGFYEARINSVDKSIINPEEARLMSIPIKIDEAFYRVNASLRNQSVLVYGHSYPLTAGMLFDAILVGEKRKIWQWILAHD